METSTFPRAWKQSCGGGLGMRERWRPLWWRPGNEGEVETSVVEGLGMRERWRPLWWRPGNEGEVEAWE